MSKRDKADDWMPFYVGDYLADTTHLSRDQHGGYLLLLFAGWKRGGRLPDDDVQLSNIVKATLREWRTLRPILAPFFDIANGLWTQKRLASEHASAADRKAKAVAKAALGAASRWGHPVDKYASGIPPSNAPSIARSNHQALPDECPLPLSLSTAVVNASNTAPARKQSNGGDKYPLEKQKHAAWKHDANAAAKKGKSLGISAHPGESLEQFVARIEGVKP